MEDRGFAVVLHRARCRWRRHGAKRRATRRAARRPARPFAPDQRVGVQLHGLPDVKEADVQVQLDPPWDQTKMSDAARLEADLFEGVA